MKKILIVDNSSFFLTVLTKILEAEGHEVRSANDGLAALDMLPSYRPEIVFTDLVMPRIGGDKLCRIIRRTPDLQDVFLVVLSAIAVEERLDFHAFGADACIAKGPYTEIKKHILTVLNAFDENRRDTMGDRVIGTEKVYRREITTELISTKNHFEITLKNIAEGFLELALDHRIIYLNDTAAAIFAKPEEELLATDFADHFSGEHRLRVREFLENLGQEQKKIGEETPLCIGNRQLCLHALPVTDHTVQSLIVIVHDITQRKQAEQELTRHRDYLEEIVSQRTAQLQQANETLRTEVAIRRKQEEQLRKARDEWERTFDAVGDIATIQDKETRVVRINKAGCKALGATSAEELIGKRCQEIFHCTNEVCNACPTMLALADGQVHDAEIKHQLGSVFFVSASPILDEEGRVTGLAHTAKDITGQKKLEQRLRQAEKMEAIGTLAGGIAHDFNNILTAMIGYTELALDSAAPESILHNDLQAVLQAGDRAVRLIQQILSFSRQEEQQRREILVAPLVKETLKLMDATLPDNIHIETAINAEQAVVHGDPTQIHQVIMNLCTNGVQAMHGRGGTLRVELTTETITETPRQAGRTATPPGPYLRLHIADNGPGISPEARDHIFEPYFTTKEPGRGTGLGLATTHSIVNSHGGWITVVSQNGEGAVFQVFLPLISEAPLAAPSEHSGPTPSGHGHILLVDDEAMVAEMTRRLLEGLGYTVTPLSSPITALALFRSLPHDFDLVLTDLVMPGMPGAELAEELLRIRPELPIVLCTGYNEKAQEMMARNPAIKGHAQKPFTATALAQVIHQALTPQKAGQQGVNQP